MTIKVVNRKHNQKGFGMDSILGRLKTKAIILNSLLVVEESKPSENIGLNILSLWDSRLNRILKILRERYGIEADFNLNHIIFYSSKINPMQKGK